MPRGGRGKYINQMFQGIGSMVSSNSRTKAHVLGNRAKYGIAPKGSSSKAATRAYQNAMATRQAQVGRRATGAAVALGGVGMYKNRDGSRGGYRPPSTRTARGSGRYA